MHCVLVHYDLHHDTYTGSKLRTINIINDAMLPDLKVQGNLSSVNFFGVGFYSINSRALK